MPNWCSNTVTIQGSTKILSKVWEEANRTNENNEVVGLLQAMVPMPDELEGTTSPSDTSNWYDWRVSNWGTKWDIDIEGLEFIDNGDGTAEIVGGFDSAWSPPIEAFETFCSNMEGVYVKLYYWETGVGFIGCWDSDDGDDYYEYDNVKAADIYDVVPGYIVDHWNLQEELQMWEDEMGEEV